MAYAVVFSFGSVVVDSLFIVVPNVCGTLCLVLVLLCSDLCPFEFCNLYDGEERTDCFTLIVFLMSYNCYICIFVALPHSAVDWSVDCDFGIFLPRGYKT